MLRESSMQYSSLPQEEGENTYVTTRTAGEPHPQGKGRLISIVVTILLISGVPLLIIAPLVLSKGSGRSDISLILPNSGGSENGDDTVTDNQKTPTPPPHEVIPTTELKNITFKPPTIAPRVPTTTKPIIKTTTTTSTTTTTTTPTPTPTTTTTTTTAAPIIIAPIAILPSNSGLKPTVGLPIEGAGKNQSGAADGTTDISHKEPEGGAGSGAPGDGNLDPFNTSSQDLGTQMTTFVLEHQWLVVGGAVTAAAVIALLVAMVAWIIQNRLASRRRRINLQRVITDLQSRDKVVLLNSEDSEDEA